MKQVFFSLFSLAICLSASAQQKEYVPFSLPLMESALREYVSGDVLADHVYLLEDIDHDGDDEVIVKEKVRNYNTYYVGTVGEGGSVDFFVTRSSGGYEDFAFTPEGFVWHYEEHTGGLSKADTYYKLKDSKVVMVLRHIADFDVDNPDAEPKESYSVELNGKVVSTKEEFYAQCAPKVARTHLNELEGWKSFEDVEGYNSAVGFGEKDKLDTYFGDLNKDGIQDKVEVLTPDGNNDDVLHLAQPVLTVSFGNEDGSFSTFKTCNYVLPHAEDDNEIVDLEVSITSKGLLRIAYSQFFSMGGWGNLSCSYLFRYQDGDFYMIGMDTEEIARNTGEAKSVSINYLTKKKQVRTYNVMNKNSKKKETWSKIDVKKLEHLGKRNLKI